MDLPLISESEPLQVDDSVLSEMEMIKETGFLKEHKAPGPDGLQSSFFTTSEEVLPSQLTKVLGSVWDWAEIPEKWC